MVFDPLTGNPDGTLRLPFAGNIVPAARISPISRRLMDLIPPPVRPGITANHERNTVRVKDTESFDVKVDHHFNEANRVFYRYSFQRPPL